MERLGDDERLAATRARLVERFGARVERWWQELPEATAALAERWGLALGEPVGRGNTSLVLSCRRADGQAAMLKLAPEPELARAEAEALGCWAASRRVPALLEHDHRAGALLLEALPEETPIADRERTPPLAEVAALLSGLRDAAGARRPPPSAVPLAERVRFVFSHWIERGERDAAVPVAVPRALLERGGELAAALAADGGAPGVLLHGDLHPGNVLDAGGARGLVAIDPRACVGDPVFDAVDWVLWRAVPEEWERRLEPLAAAAGGDAERLRVWCAAFAALLAAGEARRGRAGSERFGALLALAA